MKDGLFESHEQAMDMFDAGILSQPLLVSGEHLMHLEEFRPIAEDPHLRNSIKAELLYLLKYFGPDILMTMMIEYTPW